MAALRMLMIALSLAMPAIAQDAQDDSAGPQRRPEGRGGGPGRWANRMYDRLARDLNLDEQQRAQFDEIAAKQREQMRANFERMRAEREAGQQSGDDEAGQAPDQGGNGGRGGRRQFRMMPENQMNEFFDQIEPILHEDQIAKLDEARDRAERRAENMRLPQELREQLNLDPDQQARYDELLQGIREERRGRMEGMRPLVEELRAAEESGDEQRIAAAQSKMDEMRGDNDDFRAQFLAQVEPLLRDDQKQILDSYRDEPAGAAAAQGGAPDYRNVLKAAKRAKLTSEQARRLKEIEREAARTARSQRDPESKALLTASVTEDVRKLLSADQMPRFERAMERFTGRGK
jgi:Spy/CpxP family protein refolding chaperone